MPTAQDLGKLVKAKHPGAYDDMGDGELGVKVKAKYPGAYDDFADPKEMVSARILTPEEEHAATAEPSLAQKTDHALRDFAGGAAQELNPFSMLQGARDLAYNAVRHPINTTNALLQRQAAPLAKAIDSAKAGDYGNALRHGAMSLIPLAGPGIDEIADEAGNGQMAHALGRALGFGLTAALPGSTVGSELATATKAAAKAAPLALARGGATAIEAATGRALPDMLRKAAETDYARVLNPTTKGNKVRTARIVPEMIDRGLVAPTLDKLGNKVAALKESSGQAIGDAFDALPGETRVPLQPILDNLQRKSNDTFTVSLPDGQQMPMSAAARRGMEHVQGIADTLRNAASEHPETGEMGVPVGALRQLRQHFDETAKMAGRYDGKNLPDPSEAAAHGMGADVVRGQIAQQFPEIAAANKEYSFASDADRVIQDTLLRRQGQAKPLGTKILAAAGTGAGYAAHGIPGAVLGKVALGSLESMITSPAWRTVSAVAKNRLAQALESGTRGPAEFAVSKIAKEIEQAPAAALPAAAEQIEAPAAPAPVEAPKVAPARNPFEKIDDAEGPLTKSQRAIQSEFHSYLKNDPEGALAEYQHRFGNVVNADSAKELSPDYLAEPSTASPAVHEGASALAKEVFRRKLAEPVDPAHPDVVMMAGAPGAGKTSAQEAIPEVQGAVNGAHAIFDGTLANPKSAAQKVQQALDSGRNVHVVYVHRDPLEAYANGVLTRAARHGRTVPMDAYADAHLGIRDSMQQLAEKFKDEPRFKMSVIDNSRGANNAQRVGGIDALPPAMQATKPELVGKLQDSLDAALRAKKIPQSVYDNSTSRAPGTAPAPRPGSVAQMDPREILADPARFQFKRDTGGASGTGDELKGVQKYDPELGGVLSVWRDPADGKTYVVNGHHRLELAMRSGAPEVSVRYLNAATAAEARTKGALINIAGGRGTAIDAAKVFMQNGLTAPELAARGISIKGAVARDGQNLSKLAPSIFDHVVSGDLPVNRASTIGELLPHHGDQQAALDLLGRAEKNGKTVSDGTFRELVDLVKGGPKREAALDDNMGLFGDAPPEQESAALDMATLSDYVRKRLMTEKKLFGTVSDAGKSKVLEAAGNQLTGKNAELAEGAGRDLAIYDKLKASSGPVNDALRKAAESLGKKGAPANEIRQHAYERIRAEVQKLMGGS